MIKLRIMGDEAEVNDFAAEIQDIMRVTDCSPVYPILMSSEVRLYMDIESVGTIHVFKVNKCPRPLP